MEEKRNLFSLLKRENRAEPTGRRKEKQRGKRGKKASPIAQLVRALH
ncbi:MAG TPA: hypothetical protein P5085_03460 [Paludibacteraceae bacterium]|nr:hypothetical protein [Paludibacteraceae bacterium]